MRITAAIGLGTIWVTQRLREFLELYPDIRIELNLNDEQIDLAMRAADVALWTREPDQGDLIRRPLFSMKVRAYASSQYVRRFGAPVNVKALDEHRIVYSGVPAQHLAAITWIETVGREGCAAARPRVSSQFRGCAEICGPLRYRRRHDPRLHGRGGIGPRHRLD